jgi:hypothetical protein
LGSHRIFNQRNGWKLCCSQFYHLDWVKLFGSWNLYIKYLIFSVTETILLTSKIHLLTGQWFFPLFVTSATQ